MFRYDNRKVSRGFTLQSYDMGNTCFTDEFDPEQLKKFEVVDFTEPVKDGWKLASVSDVKENLIPAKYTLLGENEWIICKLEDGSIKGSGFGFAIDIYYKGGWKYKLLFKKESSQEITQTDKERTQKDGVSPQKEMAPRKKEKSLSQKDPQQKEKIPDKKEENPAQKRKDIQHKEKKAPQKEKNTAQKEKDPPQKNKITPEKQKSSPEKERKSQQKEKTSPQKEKSPPQKKKILPQKEQVPVQKDKSPPQNEKRHPEREKMQKMSPQKKKSLLLKEESPLQNEKSPPEKEKISPHRKKSRPQEDKRTDKTSPHKKKDTTQEEKNPPQKDKFLNVPGRQTSVSDVPSSKSSRSRSSSDIPSSRTSRSRSTSENSEGERASRWGGRNEETRKQREGKDIKEREAGLPQKRKGGELEVKSPKVKLKTPLTSRANIEKPYVPTHRAKTPTPNKSKENIPDGRPKTAPSKERREEEKENKVHERSTTSIMELILREGRGRIPHKRPKTAITAMKEKSEKEMDQKEKPKTSGKEKSEKGIMFNERPQITVTKEKTESEKIHERLEVAIAKKKSEKEKIFNERPKTSVAKNKSQNEKNFNARPKTAASKGRFIVSPGGQHWDKEEPEENIVSETLSVERWRFNDISIKSADPWNCSKLGKKKVSPQRNYKGYGTPPPLATSAFLLQQPENDPDNWRIHTQAGRRQSSVTSSLDEINNEKKTRKDSNEPKRFVKYWPSDIDSICNSKLGIGNTDSLFLRITR